MKTSSKFILNRNDKEYYYVEKSKYGDFYHVHLSNKNILMCNDHNFHAIYGNDEKISLEKFISMALLELLPGYSSDEVYYQSSEKFKIVLNKLMNSKNKKNPDLGISKTTLLEAIHIYNNLSINREVFEIPYEDNYNTIMESKKKEELESINQSTRISSITRLNREYSNELEHHKIKTKKYDNVA